MTMRPFVTVLFTLLTTVTAMEFGSSKLPVSSLLKDHSSCIERLKAETAKRFPNVMHLEPYCNDVFYLRFCLSNDYDSDNSRVDAFVDHLSWRHDGDGKEICDAARVAASEATKTQGLLDYDSVHSRAPNGNVINKFLTPSKVLSVVSPHGDMVFCMHHGKIDDKALMKSTDSPRKVVVDFMLYAKEVNSIVANRHSLQSDRLAYVLTANNLEGASLARGDKAFREALNESARIGAKHYPSLAGPTLMLNLPSWLTSFARAFAPAEVRHTLQFAHGPLKNVDELTAIANDGPHRNEFFTNLEELVYSAQ